MRVGNLKQKANQFLIIFVFGCIFIIVGLLYITQKVEETGKVISFSTHGIELVD